MHRSRPAVFCSITFVEEVGSAEEEAEYRVEEPLDASRLLADRKKHIVEPGELFGHSLKFFPRSVFFFGLW